MTVREITPYIEYAIDRANAKFDADYEAAIKENADREFDAIYKEALKEEWERNNEIARVREIKKRREFWYSLFLAIKNLGHFATIDDTNQITVTKDGIPVKVNNAVDTFNPTVIVRLRHTYQRGDSERFPRRKDGTYSWDRMARATLHYVNAQVAHAKAEANRKANADQALELRKELRLKSYSKVRVWPSVADPSATPALQSHKPVTLRIDINQSFTTEKAKEIILLLKEAGCLTQYDFFKDDETFS